MSDTIQIETETPSGRYRAQVRGIALRDIFAGLAMHAAMSDGNSFGWTDDDDASGDARAAYKFADAMLEARKEQP